MDSQPPSSSFITTTIEQQQPQRPSCPRCCSPDTRFCYYIVGDGILRPKNFCFSCNKFWAEEQETPAPFSVPLHTAAPSSCVASTHNVEICSDGRPSQRRRRQKPQPERPQLPCPRCGSSDARFLKYQSKRRTRPQHFCFSCERTWLVGSTLHGGRRGAATLTTVLRRCPRCGSTCSRTRGYGDGGRTKQRWQCLRCNKLWIREVDGQTRTQVSIFSDDAVPKMESSSSPPSASQPVAEASPCGRVVTRRYKDC